VLALVLHEPLGLELLQVMPNRVQRDPEPGGQLLGREVLRALEVHENDAARAFLAGRTVELLEDRERGTHDASMLSGAVGIVNSFKIYGANACIAFICRDLHLCMAGFTTEARRAGRGPTIGSS
jgi:hypothetical protein